MTNFHTLSRRTCLLAFSLLLVFSACQEDSVLETTTPSQEVDALTFTYKPIEGQYIVVYDEILNRRFAPLNYEQSKALSRQFATEIFESRKIPGGDNILRTFGGGIKGITAHLTEDQLFRLKNDTRIKYVEQDYEIIMQRPPWERNPDGGDGGGSTGEEVPYGITRVNGGVTYTGSNVAWILDSGIDLDHPDLNVDASRGFNAFTSGRDGKSLDDGDGHGTHVAGTVAAIDNDEGVIGVAAGATVIPVKVLDSRGSGSYSGVIAGVDHVGANGAAGDVANMSLGGPVSQALDDAVVAAAANGIKFVLAAGNSSADANNSSPARANGANVYTISAMDINDNFASFSNYGNPPIDFCAPGVSIKSTWRGGGYNTISGTSMAAPHAAGVLLLGTAGTNGNVSGDPDGSPDPIIVN